MKDVVPPIEWAEGWLDAPAVAAPVSPFPFPAFSVPADSDHSSLILSGKHIRIPRIGQRTLAYWEKIRLLQLGSQFPAELGQGKVQSTLHLNFLVVVIEGGQPRHQVDVPPPSQLPQRNRKNGEPPEQQMPSAVRWPLLPILNHFDLFLI